MAIFNPIGKVTMNLTIGQPYYVLRDKTPVPCDDPMQWTEEFETRDRHVKKTWIGGTYISTVFLGIDHAVDQDVSPILFETMIFGGSLDRFYECCSTWAEAEIMHDRIVHQVEAAYQRGFYLAGVIMAIAIILAQVFFSF
jgi:hypothetical protein